ncbi:hypothetical protein L1049_010626 [Liquidambar formosana]|uniref:Protein SCAR n=1 Tax=Liquidambar formosana TaxID=63359 RepID=A0AAP0R4M4_LIQFO
MPLVRFEVRNEYGLGLPDLYREANREDPKAVLDGVAVAGLVGILRQLGDLAEFAAEVFHGLQEQVMTTASRSHKLRDRVQHIEDALPLLEKAVLAQTSHLHFCYTVGSEWHARIRNEQNHFIYKDLPRFIMDSYEECRDPPCLHLLDKFDSGGPGSCLSRYSDPTFFKRVSASSDEVNAERAQRNKKTRKSKKKRSWQRNGEVSHRASLSTGSGRYSIYCNFLPQVSVGKHLLLSLSPTIDTTLKSDLGDQSHSFDSKTGSGYIECVFRLSSSMQPEEQEPKESSCSRLEVQHNDTPDLAFLDEQTKVDDFPRSPLRDQTAPSSSFVTWDEKTEIVEPEGQQCYSSDEAPEVLPINSCIDTQERGDVDLRNVDQVDILFEVENTPRSISGGNQLDEIESETDNYMDALNTIESESENDFDCQTKREVEQYSSNFNNSDREDGMHEITAHNSDHEQSPQFESHSSSYCSPNKGMAWDLPDSVSSESVIHEQSPQIAGRSHPDSSTGIDLGKNGDILDGSKLESVISEPLSSGSTNPNSQNPTSDKVISSVCESQESPAEFSGVNSIKFWTNGGLLGLEPSKPPDISVSNAVSQDSGIGSKNDTISPLVPTAMLKDGGQTGKPSILVKNSNGIEEDPSSKCSTSCHNDREDGTSMKKTPWEISPANLDSKLEKSGDYYSNRFNNSHGHDLNDASVMTPGTESPVTPDVKVTFTDANQENDENSSRIFGLSHRLLVNGFRRKVSLVHDEKSELASSVKSGVFENKSGDRNGPYKTSPDTTFKGQFGNESAVDSFSSSPPLEHMKISFHPMNSFNTSKLKLKFPDESHRQEFVRDLFPSFQLVPEPFIPLHDINSDSDDDTFCRSSPYMSDDCRSHHSESNSEQWESEETPRSKDHELYDALCRISSTESVSSSLEIEGTPPGIIRMDCGLKSSYFGNGVEPSHSGSVLDLPSFDAVNPSLHQQIKYDSAPTDLLVSQYPKEPAPPMPPPPPLPPLQWRVLNSHSDVAGDEQDIMSEALSHAPDLEHLEFTVSQQQPKLQPTKQQQPKPDPTKQQQIIEEAIAFKPRSKQQDEQKLNGQQEANQAANGKGMDEKEDFLHQIRTKVSN